MIHYIGHRNIFQLICLLVIHIVWLVIFVGFKFLWILAVVSSTKSY